MSVEAALISQQMSEPHAAVATFTLPCGYYDPATGELHRDVDVHEITGNEEDMLANADVLSEAKMERLLASCTRRIGPITDKQKINQMITDLPGGDRIFLLFAIRRVTLGNEMVVREQCPKCAVRTLFTIDLRDLGIQEMPDPSKRVFDVKTPRGHEVRFRVSTGHDEKRVSELRRKEKNKPDALSMAMLQRIELVDGQAPTLATLKTMSMLDRQWLRDEFQSVEGGVDTGLELECPKCGTEWTTELNASAGSFFSRSDRAKPSKRKSST